MLLLLLAPLASAQTIAPMVHVTDVGAIEAHPGLGGSTLDELYGMLPEAFVGDVVAASDEKAWPKGMASAAARAKSASAIEALHAYQVARLQDGRVLLWLPTGDNAFAKKKVQFDRDLFLVVPAGAVAAAEGGRPFPSGRLKGVDRTVVRHDDPAWGKVLGAQLEQVVLAFPDHFAAIRGAERRIDGIVVEKTYEVTARIAGAADAYLYGDTLYVATYGPFADDAEAHAAYTTMVAVLDGLKLTCCQYTRTVGGGDGRTITSYVPDDGGPTDAVFEVEDSVVPIRQPNGEFVSMPQFVLRVRPR